MPKKKGKKKKKEEAPKEEETDYDNMDLEMLREVVPMLRTQKDKSQLDRNYVQLERDTIQTFYDITKQEVRETDHAILSKEREMESMEDNHRVEVRVYLQKVKHLEYEHKNNLTAIGAEGESFLNEETENHDDKSLGLKNSKQTLLAELADLEWSSAEEIEQLQLQQAKNLRYMREEFEKNLNALGAKQEEKLSQLQSDLELRRKVHIHEIEERKNLHINDLMRNHAKAFTQMKAYYNDITTDNLKLIRSLKDEVAEMKKKAVANQRVMNEITQKNLWLKEPLAVTVAEVADLRAQLKGREKG